MSKLESSLTAFVCFAALSLQCWASPNGAQNQQSIQQLKEDTPIERQLAGGETHVYRVELMAGQYLHLVVDQRGIDVVVAIISPDNKPLVEVDSPNGSQGPEPVSLVAEASGSYQVLVRSLEKGASPARYEIRIEELRQARPQDSRRIAAQKAFSEGQQLHYVNGTSESRRESIRRFEFSLQLWQELGDRVREAATLDYIGQVHHFLGENQAAVEYYERALAVSRSANDREGAARTLNNIGLVYDRVGEKQRALDYYDQAMPLWHALGDHASEAVGLYNMGLLHVDLGDYDKALELYNQALPLRRAAGDRKGEAYTLDAVANLYADQGERLKAMEYYDQALQLSREVGDERKVATILSNMAWLLDLIGDYQKALDYLNQALPLRRSTGDNPGLAASLSGVGDVYANLGETQKARDYYDQALPLRRAVGDRKGEAATLAGIARIERDEGQLPEARAHIEQALQIIESLRTKVISPELRASFLATTRSSYDFYIDLLMRLHRARPSEGFDALALQASQRARARSLLDMLAESRIDIRQDLTKEQREREDAIFVAISNVQKELWKQNLSPGRERQLKAELAAREDDLDAFRTELRRASPRYAGIQYPEPVGAQKIQKELLDPGTALIEYVLGEKQSFAWVVTRERLSSFVLAPGKEIEGHSNAYRKAISEKVSSLTAGTALAQLASRSRALYQELFQPLEKSLSSIRRLIIIPDGALAYLPLETLLCDDQASPAKASAAPPRYLLERFAISYAPSASALVAIKSRTRSASGEPASQPKGLLAFGDPIYDKADLSAGERSATPVSSRSMLNLYAERGFELSRLPYTREEVSGISSLFPASQRRIYLGTEAREENVKAEKLDQYRYIHFAAHGVVDEDKPMRSGIVLSLNSGATEDGILQMSEIMRLKLNADLVTLSACRTGLGRLLSGEGIIGLTRAFFYAGTSSVVVSLWNVNDLATADLMKTFYQKLNSGMSKDEALQQAKLTLINGHQRAWRHPYFWAPFVLVGEQK
jgi:CHAT domain-containing protein/Tfp pilus assembly protein PilF